jgi:uncharacterized protein
MPKFIIILAGIIFISCGSKQMKNPGIDEFKIHSISTSDDYIIDIRKPTHFDSLHSYHVIIAADDKIGLGQYLLGTNPSWKATLPDSCIIITIGHIGNWHDKRARDFLPSDISKDSSENFGKASLFYSFLKEELFLQLKKKFPNQKDLSFIGHSFSGLFCLYASFQKDHLFDHYFAISPSVWANDEELLKIENEYAKINNDLEADIHIYAGGLEIFNKVLSSSKEFYTSIRSRNYKNLYIDFTTIPGANHFSVRKPAVDKILEIFGSDRK